MVGRDFLMKRYKTANRIFLASAILLGIAMGVRYFYRDALAGLFYFLAQSCLIGCFADWFAVEALFRNRLHLPLFKPLIPANREAVLRRLQETVEGKLVGKETFTDLLKNFSLIQFIEKEAEGSVKDIETDLARSGGELLLGLMENHKKDLSRWIRQGVDNVRVSLGFYLREKALEGNYTEQFLDKLLEEAQRAVKSDQMKQIITNKLEKLGENRERGFLERLVYSFAKFTNTVDYEDMAEAFLAALSERIELWRVDIHPFHKTLLKEWNAAVEAFLKQKKRKKPLSILRKNSINLFPWKKKRMPYTTVFMKNGRQEINLKNVSSRNCELCSTMLSEAWRKTKNSVPALMRAPELWEEIFWKKNIPIFLPSPQIS